MVGSLHFSPLGCLRVLPTWRLGSPDSAIRGEAVASLSCASGALLSYSCRSIFYTDSVCSAITKGCEYQEVTIGGLLGSQPARDHPFQLPCSAGEEAEVEMDTDLPGATQQARTLAWNRIRVYIGPGERGLVPWGCPEEGGEPSGGRCQASSPELGAEGGDVRPSDLSESWLGVCV